MVSMWYAWCNQGDASVCSKKLDTLEYGGMFSDKSVEKIDLVK